MSLIPRAYAHEVYVLDHTEITHDLAKPEPNFLSTIKAHPGQFLFWGVGIAILIGVIFFISVSRPIERILDPLLIRLKRFAPIVAQFTIGSALLASGYYKAIFGTELPLKTSFGVEAGTIALVLVVIGLMLILGVLPRIAGLITLAIIVFMIYQYGFYMLNYFTYAGEALVITLFGGAYTLIDSKRVSKFFTKLAPPYLHKYKFLLLRVLFGISLIYASLYAKLIHGALALDVVNKYHLTNYFPFDPLFLVLGAMLVEIGLGLFFMIGFEIRFTALFFLTFLTLSILFFGEAVWPHIILVGTALAMFLHGYDKYTLSQMLGKNKKLEPVL